MGFPIFIDQSNAFLSKKEFFFLKQRQTSLLKINETNTQSTRVIYKEQNKKKIKSTKQTKQKWIHTKHMGKRPRNDHKVETTKEPKQ